MQSSAQGEYPDMLIQSLQQPLMANKERTKKVKSKTILASSEYDQYKLDN